MIDFDQKTYLAVYDQFQVTISTMVTMTEILMIMQVGPGDDYVLTVGGFNAEVSTLGDAFTRNTNGVPSPRWNHNGMKFSTK